MEASDVSNFLRTRFDHANTVLSIVGGVSSETVRELVRRHFRSGEPGRTAPAAARAHRSIARDHDAQRHE